MPGSYCCQKKGKYLMLRNACILFTVCSLVWAANAAADIKLNEIYRNPEDLVDGDDGVGREFFEIISSTGGVESLAGLTFVEINGQDFPDTGTITQAIDLSPFSTGANGLFLWRDTADVLLPSPDVDTTVNVAPFTPHLADDNVTYVLVDGFSGAVGTDLDADDDGALDASPWTSVHDALGLLEGGEPGYSYSTQLGGADFINTTFGPDAFARLPVIGQWFAFDSGSGEEDPTYYGPFYANDPGDNQLEDGRSFPFAESSTFYAMTPGSANSMVPEPCSITILWIGLLVSLFLRRRR
jgi:hypothetical protein